MGIGGWYRRAQAEASPLCVFLKSAQAAEARHQRARNAPLLPGRSESVVRVPQKRSTLVRPGPTLNEKERGANDVSDLDKIEQQKYRRDSSRKPSLTRA